MWAVRATRPRRAPLSWISWLEEFGAQLKPPVANKLIYGSGKLKVMVVGGPNSRTDYHIQEGEELFWQVIVYFDGFRTSAGSLEPGGFDPSTPVPHAT